MKKIIALLLVLALSLSLCACGKNALVKDVEKQIAALENVSYEDKAAVEAAREAYDKLLSSNQKQVKNLEILEQAEAAIAAIESDTRKEVDQICVAYGPVEALAMLEDLEQIDYVKQWRRTLANRVLRDYVLENGTPCDILGEEMEDGGYRRVTVGKYYFLVDSNALVSVSFYEQDDAPVSSIMLEGFRFNMRSKTLMVSEDVAYYGKTEHFTKDGDTFYVTWNTHIYATTEEELGQLPVEISNSSIINWPYNMEQQQIQENIHSDVDEFLSAMDSCMQQLGVVCSAYDLVGVFE